MAERQTKTTHNQKTKKKGARRNKERRCKKQRGGKGETRREKVVTKELGCELSVQHSYVNSSQFKQANWILGYLFKSSVLVCVNYSVNNKTVWTQLESVKLSLWCSVGWTELKLHDSTGKTDTSALRVKLTALAYLTHGLIQLSYQGNKREEGCQNRKSWRGVEEVHEI